MRHIHLAVIPADGIGCEVIQAAQTVLQVLAELDGGVSFVFDRLDWGSERYLGKGAMMPRDGLQFLEGGGFDAILLGPVGDPRIADHVTLWGLLLPIRQGLEQYVNIRPARLFDGVDTPLKGKTTSDLNMVCMRENSEGEYSGAGGRVHVGKPAEVAIQSTVFTRSVTERLMRFAFEWAADHGRTRVTNVTKSNSMQHNMVFWDDVFRDVSCGFPGMKTDQQLVDSMTVRMVNSPESLDVFVASNLFGDILSDLAAALTGSLGLAPSANINPERRYPGVFQAIHGSASEIAGKGWANPIASLWSAQLMLEYLGEPELAGCLMAGIESLLSERRIRTRDLGGVSSTTEVTQEICNKIRREG